MITYLALMATQQSLWPTEYELAGSSVLDARRQSFGESTYLELDGGLQVSFSKRVPYSYDLVKRATFFAPNSATFAQFGSFQGANAGEWKHFTIGIEEDGWSVLRSFEAGKRGVDSSKEVSLGVYRYGEGKPLRHFLDAVSAANSPRWQPMPDEWLMDEAKFRQGVWPVNCLARLGPYVVETVVRVDDPASSNELAKSLFLWVRFRAIKYRDYLKPGDGETQVTVPGIGQVNVLRMSSRDYVSSSELRRVGVEAVTVPGESGPALLVTRAGRTVAFKAFDWQCQEGSQDRDLELPSIPFAGDLYVSLRAVRSLVS